MQAQVNSCTAATGSLGNNEDEEEEEDEYDYDYESLSDGRLAFAPDWQNRICFECANPILLPPSFSNVKSYIEQHLYTRACELTHPSCLPFSPLPFSFHLCLLVADVLNASTASYSQEGKLCVRVCVRACRCIYLYVLCSALLCMRLICAGEGCIGTEQV